MSLSPQRLVTCHKGLLCGLLLLAQMLSAAPNSPAQTAAPEVLTPGRTFRREIGGREVHAYTFELGERQFASFSVGQQGSDVVVTIIDAEGVRTRVDRPNGSRGREAVSYIAARQGTYRLEVRTLETVAPRGYYELVLNDSRPATARDESRLAAERAVSEGEILRARRTAASLPQALEKFDQATAIWQALEDPYETAVAAYGKCLAYRMLGDSGEAVKECSESAETMRKLGDDYGEAVARTGRAWAYLYLGDVGMASADFNAALATRKRIGDRQGEALDLLGIGWAHALRDEYERALEYFQQSLQALDDIGDPRGRHVRLGAIGEVYRRTGRPSEAVGYLTQALQLARVSGNDRGGEAEILTGIGWCRYALGQFGQATESFNEALPVRREIGDRTGEAATMLGLAHVERAQGNLHNARVNVDAALAIVESLRARVNSQPLRLSFFALAQDYYEFYIDLLMRMHKLSPDRGFDAAALEVSERARARSMLDLLSEAGVDMRRGVPADLLERERSLRLRLNSAANYQRLLLSETYTAAQAASAAKDVEELSAALGEVESRIRQVSPRYAELTRPQPLSAAQIQRELSGDDTLLLEYALGRERSFLWAVSAAGITAYELPGRQEIERAAARVRELLTSRNRAGAAENSEQRRVRAGSADALYEEAALRLGEMLLAPAADRLKSQRLVVVAPGVLQLIPFAALPVSQPPAVEHRPLILNHELVTLPSASTLALLRRELRRREPPGRLISIVADPVFSRTDERFGDAARHNTVTDAALRLRSEAADDNGQVERATPRLFRTRWESEQIAALAPPGSAALFIDFEATPEAVAGEVVGGSRIVHLATHAIIDDARPQLSGVVLSMFDSEGRARDGFLRAHDISNLRLSADLVVLSACRTAAGQEFRGEGLVGLARGFMFAGAPRVIGSLWDSNDKATAELMVRFYRRLLKDSMSPAAALRAAQLEMWRDKRWRPAYFWAGFVLQGDWR